MIITLFPVSRRLFPSLALKGKVLGRLRFQAEPDFVRLPRSPTAPLPPGQTDSCLPLLVRGWAEGAGVKSLSSLCLENLKGFQVAVIIACFIQKKPRNNKSPSLSAKPCLSSCSWRVGDGAAWAVVLRLLGDLRDGR